MDDDEHITLDIPDPEGFNDEYGHSLPISSVVVEYAIDLLQCFIAQYRHDEGCSPDHAVWDRLAAAAGHALAGLLSAHSAYYHDRDARPLIEQIAFFCRDFATPRRLAPLREPGAVHVLHNGPQPADIVEALLALHELSVRRGKEWQQQAAAADPTDVGREPATERDPGWEF